MRALRTLLKPQVVTQFTKLAFTVHAFYVTPQLLGTQGKVPWNNIIKQLIVSEHYSPSRLCAIHESQEMLKRDLHCQLINHHSLSSTTMPPSLINHHSTTTTTSSTPTAPTYMPATTLENNIRIKAGRQEGRSNKIGYIINIYIGVASRSQIHWRCSGGMLGIGKILYMILYIWFATNKINK